MVNTLQGHSSHVTNIRFTYEDQRIVSTGGNDTAILVWDFGKMAIRSNILSYIIANKFPHEH